ncbi:MAG: hypothetical protein KAG64_04385 [Bacteroidales bacterium]|nr:hypothetical protein [Bacteroidales bacterium]
MRKLPFFLAFVVISLIFSSCSNKEEKVTVDIKPGFENYISSFTSGTQLSRRTSFIIKLQQSANDSIIAGQEVKELAFEINPQVKGKVIWINSRSLEFIPDQALKSGSVYGIKFHLKNFINVPDEFSVLEYQIRTVDQAYRYIDNGLSTYESNMLLLKYEGKIITADWAESKRVEEMITAKFSKNSSTILWKHEPGGKNHYFYIDSLERSESAKKLNIFIDASSIGVESKEDYSQKIPGLKDFEVLQVQAYNENVQYVLVSFSDPLELDQNLKGFLYFKDDNYPSYVIDGNRIKVFTSKKLEGEQQLHIAPGIRNALGYKFQTKSIFPISFESNKPALEILGQGVIIPSSKGLIFPFKAVSVKMVDLKIIQIYEDNVLNFLQGNSFSSSNDIRLAGRLIAQKRLDLSKMLQADLNKWNTYKIDLADYITLQAGAIYRVTISFRPAYSIYPCDSNKAVLQSDAEYEESVRKNMKSYDENRYYYGGDDYSYYYDDYDYRQRGNPCNSNYYRSNYDKRIISQNLYASNFGVSVKGTPNNKYVVAVSDLNSTDPVKGVKVVFYNLQKQIIGEGKTNDLGISIEQLSAKPYFVVAQKGKERGYVRLNNNAALSMSNFNVSGMHVQQGLKAYLYGERDVWRPGDNIYLTLILEDLKNRLPADHPIIFDLINPMGQTMIHQINKSGDNGFYSFHVKTERNAPTGNWTARVKVGGAVFSRTIRIETIKPNRIKAKIDFKNKVLTQKQLRSPLKINANWLHGSPAKDLDIKVLLNLRPATTTFKEFDNYSFLFPNSQFKSEEVEVYKGTLDKEGKTKFNLRISVPNAPGMLNANFVTRVFEKGGDFSILTQKVKYSPYESYVGVKMNTNGRNGWYKTDTKYQVSLASVDENGKPVKRNAIKVKMYKISWRWWWNSYDDNLASYIGSNSRRAISTQYVNTKTNGKGSFEVKINYHDYDDNGRYLIVAEDPISGHKTGMIVYFSKWYGRIGGGADGANILSFDTDKDKYKVGETVKVSIPTSKNGRALVSIESGSDIVDIFWVKTQENETQFSFPVTKQMAPNVYINISLIQPHAQTINDNPIRMYGVIPIKVLDPNTKLEPQIGVAKSLKPEKEFEVAVSEKSGKAMTYTLAIVDEGLLDITNFKTPNPWARFYARVALAIRSWDIYDFVVGAYGARLEKAFAIGGDGSAPDPSKNKANRFKPVVLFAGPFTIDKGETQKHKFMMPNYIGSVRIMVVAGNNGAYGNADKAVPVKEDLMLLATLPRVLGPQEEVVLPVTIFAMSKKVKNVKVSLKTNDMLQIVGSNTQTTTFNKEGDQMVYFRLKVNKKLGKATARIEAVSGSIKAHYDIELNVRTPNLASIKIKDSLVSKGGEWSVVYQPMGISSTNSVVLEVSGVPSMGLDFRLKELIGYPHGCIEQTTSKILPQLFLSDLVNLSNYQNQEVENNVMEGINRLRSFQLRNGGFSYWPGNSYTDEWGSTYAGHLLLIAEQKGYQLPSRMKSSWIYYQRTSAQSWVDRGVFGSELNQAYRLYTLALAGKAEMGAMNRMSQKANLNNRSRLMLALAYAQVGQNKMAKKLVSESSLKSLSNKDYYHDNTYGSATRDMAINLMLLTKLGETDKAFLLVKTISRKLDSERWLSTQTMAYSLMAVSQYYEGQKPESVKFSYTWNGKKESFDSHNFVFQTSLPDAEKSKSKLKFKNESSGSLYVRLIQKGVPVEGEEENRSDNLKMKLLYVDMEGNEIDPTRLEQGTDFKALVYVTNPGYYGYYSNMALTQIFPSGWEIINTRLLGQNNASSAADYTDIRDDRVYIYFGIQKSRTLKYVVLLNASYEGSFYKPAINCSAMYDNSIGAVKKGTWVEVFK